MPEQFLFSLTIAGIYLLAGSVKGVFGIGLPTTSVTLMTILFDRYVFIVDFSTLPPSHHLKSEIHRM